MGYKVGQRVKYIRHGYGCEAIIGQVYTIYEIDKDDPKLPIRLAKKAGHWCSMSQIQPIAYYLKRIEHE